MTASQCVLKRDRSRVVAGLTGLVKRQPMLVSLFDDPRLHRWVRQTLAQRPIAAVRGYSVQMAHFVPALPEAVRFVMDFVDFDSAKYASYGAAGGGPMAWINRREGRVLLGFERATAARADVSVFVSEAEAALFRQVTGLDAARVTGVENGVALDYFDPAGEFDPIGRSGGSLIVFTAHRSRYPE